MGGGVNCDQSAGASLALSQAEAEGGQRRVKSETMFECRYAMMTCVYAMMWDDVRVLLFGDTTSIGEIDSRIERC